MNRSLNNLAAAGRGVGESPTPARGRRSAGASGSAAAIGASGAEIRLTKRLEVEQVKRSRTLPRPSAARKSRKPVSIDRRETEERAGRQASRSEDTRAQSVSESPEVEQGPGRRGVITCRRGPRRQGVIRTTHRSIATPNVAPRARNEAVRSEKQAQSRKLSKMRPKAGGEGGLGRSPATCGTHGPRFERSGGNSTSGGGVGGGKPPRCWGMGAPNNVSAVCPRLEKRS